LTPNVTAMGCEMRTGAFSMAQIHRFASCKILCSATTVARREDSCNPGIECVVYRFHVRTTNRIGNCTRKLGFVFVDDMQDIGEYFLLLWSFSSCCVGFNTTTLCQCLGAKSDPKLHSHFLFVFQEMGCNFLQTGIKKCFSDTFPSKLLIVDFLPGSHKCYKAAMRT
jgi:hypothetical protein